MMATDVTPAAQPNVINRIRSRQAGHPSGLLGRIIGRVMVKDTAGANDRAIDLLDLNEVARASRRVGRPVIAFRVADLPA